MKPQRTSADRRGTSCVGEQPELGEPVEPDLATTKRRMAIRGWVEMPCSLAPAEHHHDARAVVDWNVSIGDDVSSRPSPVPVIRRAIRFW